MKIVVDYTRCAGMGLCEAVAPKYFEVNDAGENVLLQEQVDDADQVDVDDAVTGCPTEAISLQ